MVVLGRVPEGEDAELPGYERFRIDGQCYPAVVLGNGTVRGRVLNNVTREELDRLDKFEDPAYERRIEYVRSCDTGRMIRARVWARDSDHVSDLDGEWSLEHFVLVDEDWYVQWCHTWATEN